MDPDVKNFIRKINQKEEDQMRFEFLFVKRYPEKEDEDLAISELNYST